MNSRSACAQMPHETCRGWDQHARTARRCLRSRGAGAPATLGARGREAGVAVWRSAALRRPAAAELHSGGSAEPVGGRTAGGRGSCAALVSSAATPALKEQRPRLDRCHHSVTDAAPAPAARMPTDPPEPIRQGLRAQLLAPQPGRPGVSSVHVPHSH